LKRIRRRPATADEMAAWAATAADEATGRAGRIDDDDDDVGWGSNRASLQGISRWEHQTALGCGGMKSEEFRAGQVSSKGVRVWQIFMMLLMNIIVCHFVFYAFVAIVKYLCTTARGGSYGDPDVHAHGSRCVSSVKSGHRPALDVTDDERSTGGGGSRHSATTHLDSINVVDPISKGVTLRSHGTYQVQIWYLGQSRYVGCYSTQVEGASAYQIADQVLLKSTIKYSLPTKVNNSDVMKRVRDIIAANYDGVETRRQRTDVSSACGSPHQGDVAMVAAAATISNAIIP
jgi:hypothetical protein